MAFRKHLSGQKGFTLIELLVVVAILGILATVAFPRIMGAIDSARDRKALADMTVIRDALERFYLDYAVYPPNLQWLVTGEYIDSNTTFTNSFDNRYYYLVDLTATAEFKDYRLGDPGQTPAAGFDPAGTALPEGVAAATDGTCLYWSTAALTADVVRTYTSVVDTSSTVTFSLNTDATDTTSTATGTATRIGADPDPTTGTWEWTYQGQP